MPARERGGVRVEGTGWAGLVVEAERRGSAAMAVAWADGGVDEWWDGEGPRRIECMSATKLVVAMGCGLSVGLDGARLPLSTWIPEWEGDGRGSLTLAHVLSHSTGLEVRPAADVYAASDVRRLVLDLGAGGPRWAYNNAAFNIAGLVVERATGTPVSSVVAERLFGPLGIDAWDWQVDPAGFPLCMAGLQLQAAHLARVAAQFLVAEPIVPSEWLAAMQPREGSEVGLGTFADFAWIDRSGPEVQVGEVIGFGHSGDYGQYVTVQPQAGFAAVRMRTVYDRDDADGAWDSFPGDAHRALA